MKEILAQAALAVVLLFSIVAQAQDSLTARIDMNNAITIQKAPCASAVILDLIKPEYQKDFFMADMLYEGKHYGACWTLGSDGQVYIVDTEGDITPIPAQAFHSEGI